MKQIIPFFSLPISVYLICAIVKQIISSNPSKYVLLYGSIVGYMIGGFISGIVHWFFDSYETCTLNKYHRDFRNHHDNPMSLEKSSDFQHLIEITPLLVPVLFLCLYTKSILIKIILLIGCIIGNFSQIIHKYSHRRFHENDKDENGKKLYLKVNPIIKFMQDLGIILHPNKHSAHHITELVNYCIAHSNADKLFQYIMIETIGLRTAIFTNNNHKYKKLNKYERSKFVKRTTLCDVINEQKYIIIITMLFMITN